MTSRRHGGATAPADREDGWLAALFACIDRGDAEAFAGYLAPGARFCFGNAPPVSGRDAIRENVTSFLAALARVEHRLADCWVLPGAAVATGTVTYTRHDGSTLQAPFANVLKVGPDGIRDYRIYIDNSELFPARQGTVGIQPPAL